MGAQDWTPEQVQNASMFGVCWRCKGPMECRMVGDPPEAEMSPEGRSVAMFLVCPNCPDLYDGPAAAHAAEQLRSI